MPEPEEWIEQAIRASDGMLILFGLIVTRDFPADSFGTQIIDVIRSKFSEALHTYARQQVEMWKAERIDWLAHRCDYAPPCGRCAYCRIRDTFAALPVEGKG